MSKNRNKRRGPSRKGQAGMKRSHVAGGEAGLLYIIKDARVSGARSKYPYWLYFKRVTGYKFKKCFAEEKYAEHFAQIYLRLCCATCLENGHVQKVMDVGGVYGGYSKFPGHHNGNHIHGYEGQCPICKTVHRVVVDGHKRSLELAEAKR